MGIKLMSFLLKETADGNRQGSSHAWLAILLLQFRHAKHLATAPLILKAHLTALGTFSPLIYIVNNMIGVHISNENACTNIIVKWGKT